jgi:acyl-[acyl-carrier-protein]-phospholipid O-acyltransferase/long-chain-fatty-acid--[acyl-carrier-protein] ligase
MAKRLFYALFSALLPLLGPLVRRLFKLRVEGLENLDLSRPALLIPNHVSLIDAILLALVLPQEAAFVVNLGMAQRFSWIMQFRRHITVDPLSPYSVRHMVKTVNAGTTLVIFPEGRITTHGAMMKVYPGIGYIALRTGAPLVPIAVNGPEYSKFSYLKGKMRQTLFPAVTISVGESFRVELREGERMRAQKERAARRIAAQLQRHVACSRIPQEVRLFDELLRAAQRHGRGRVICEDAAPLGAGRPAARLTYRRLLTAAYALGRRLRGELFGEERVALLLPNSAAHVVALTALLRLGKTPAFLNYSAGVRAMADACETAAIRTIVSSRSFVDKAKLHAAVAELGVQCRVLYLEDAAAGLALRHKLGGWLDAVLRRRPPESASGDVILFTSGSEAKPKGVVLGHRSIWANVQQLRTVIPCNETQIVFAAMPMFHSFGLTVGVFLPLLTGMKTVLYPNPLHYKAIPELVYEKNATIVFGTSTFLAAYAKAAHPYDFAHSVRYVVGGAEKLKDDVRRIWLDKFGLRILEGYGTTETAPVISLNTPLHYKEGTVGCPLPGIDVRIEPVEGIEEGGRLHVRGPNVMKGYLLHGQGFVHAEEWYDTGDVADMDDEGYLTIKARLKRFAKLGGEMVPLSLVEELAGTWLTRTPNGAVSVPDGTKGERIVLFLAGEEAKEADLAGLRDHIRAQGRSPLLIPSRLIRVEKLPALGSGKTDYVTLRQWAESG